MDLNDELHNAHPFSMIQYVSTIRNPKNPPKMSVYPNKNFKKGKGALWKVLISKLEFFKSDFRFEFLAKK